MPLEPARLYSDIAQSGPPLFYPDPPTPVTFNFDQGVPAEETFHFIGMLVGDQAKADLCRRFGRNNGFCAGSPIATGDAVQLQRRQQPLPILSTTALLLASDECTR